MCAEKASSSKHFLFCHVPFQHMPCFIMYRFNTCPVLSCTDSSHALLCNVPFCHMYHFVHVLIELLYLCPMGSSPSYVQSPPPPHPISSSFSLVPLALLLPDQVEGVVGLDLYVLLTPGVRNPPPLYLTMSKLLPKVIQQNFH